MRRVKILIKRCNLESFIDLFVNRGCTASFPTLIIYHYKYFKGFGNLEILDILLKYKRGYNIGLSSSIKKNYFFEVSKILEMFDETIIRWCEKRNKQSLAYHEAIYYKDIKTIIYEISDDEGFEICENEEFSEKIDVIGEYKNLMSKDILDFKKFKKEEKLKMKMSENIKKIHEDIRENNMVEIKNLLDDPREETNSQVSKKLIGLKIGKEIKPEELLSEKEIKMIEFKKKTREELSDRLDKTIKEELRDIKYYTDLDKSLDTEFKDDYKDYLVDLYKIMTLVDNYLNPSERLMQASINLSKEYSELKKRIKKQNEEEDIKKNVSTSKGKGKAKKAELKSDVKPKEKKEFWEIEERVRGIEPSVRKYLDLCEELEEYVPIMLDAKCKEIIGYRCRKEFEILQLDLLKMKENHKKQKEEELINKIGKQEKLLGYIFSKRLTKRDIKDMEERVQNMENKYKKLLKESYEAVQILNNENYWSMPSNINILTTYHGHYDLNLQIDKSFLHERDRDRIRENTKEILREVKILLEDDSKKNEPDPVLRRKINKLFMAEVIRWDNMSKVSQYLKDVNYKKGINPTFQILRCDVMELRRDYVINCKKSMVTMDNLCFTPEEKIEAEEIIKYLKDHESSFYGGINKLRNYYDKPEWVRSNILNYSKNYNINPDLKENDWYKEYDRIIKDESTGEVEKGMNKSARFIELFGVSPFGFIIGSKTNKGQGRLRSLLPYKTDETYLQEIMLLINRDVKEENNSWLKIIQTGISKRGYQGIIADKQEIKRNNIEVLEKLNDEVKKNKQRLQISERDKKEIVYDYLTKNAKKDNFYFRDNDFKSFAVEESEWKKVVYKKREGKNQLVENKGITISFGKKMEKELAEKRFKKKLGTKNVINDMKNNGLIKLSNRYDNLVDEVSEISDEIVDSAITDYKTVYEFTDNVKRTKYRRCKENMIKQLLEEGIEKQELVKKKNEFDIANNSRANKNYNVIGMVQYIKVVLALNLMKTNTNQMIYKKYNLKRCQSKYLFNNLNNYIRFKKEENSKRVEKRCIEEIKKEGKKVVGTRTKKASFLKRGFL